jgi:hypothetical protein
MSCCPAEESCCYCRRVFFTLTAEVKLHFSFNLRVAVVYFRGSDLLSEDGVREMMCYASRRCGGELMCSGSFFSK